MPKTSTPKKHGPEKRKKLIPFPEDPFAGRKRFQKAVEDALDILDDDGLDLVALELENRVDKFIEYERATGESLSKQIKQHMKERWEGLP